MTIPEERLQILHDHPWSSIQNTLKPEELKELVRGYRQAQQVEPILKAWRKRLLDDAHHDRVSSHRNLADSLTRSSQLAQIQAALDVFRSAGASSAAVDAPAAAGGGVVRKIPPFRRALSHYMSVSIHGCDEHPDDVIHYYIKGDDSAVLYPDEARWLAAALIEAAAHLEAEKEAPPAETKVCPECKGLFGYQTPGTVCECVAAVSDIPHSERCPRTCQTCKGKWRVPSGAKEGG